MIIGVDVGTTNLKAAAFSRDGQQLAIAMLPTPSVRTPEGGAEYDPEAIWQGVASCLAQVRTQLPAVKVDGIGLASMAEAGVLVDEAGRPVYPAIAWFDPRTKPQAAALARDPGVEALYLRTGLFAMPKHGLAKLLWLKEHRSAQYERGVAWLSMAEWIALKLTGRQAACPTLAARTLAMDLTTRQWAPELVALTGPIFPALQAEGTPLGDGLTAEAAAATGLPAGTPVALAGHDHPAAALAAGITGPGQMLDSTGTAEAVIGAVAGPILTKQALASQISQGPLPVPGLYGLQAGASASGGSVEWLRSEVLDGADYPTLIRLASAEGEEPSGVLFLPHLAGGGPPAVDPASRGAFLGLTYGASRARMVRAVLEGTCFELRRMVDAMEALVGMPYQQVVVTGGHVHNPVWMQLKADILGRPLLAPDVSEATLLGAALLGGVAAGVYADPQEAAQAARHSGRVTEPDPRRAEAYNRWYEVYRQVYPSLQNVYRSWPE